MAHEDDWLTRGRAVAQQLWGERAAGQELPAQTLAPDLFAWVAQPSTSASRARSWWRS